MGETTVNIHQAKTHLSKLIEQAVAGETVIIAKAGTPKVILQPLPATQPRQPGHHAGKIHLSHDCFAPMSEEELAEIENGHPRDPLRLWPEETQADTHAPD